MKTTIKTFKYVKQEGMEVELMLPDEKTFYFETGIRRSIALIPSWISWNAEKGKPEEIWKYEIICVYRSFEAKIEQMGFQVSELEKIYNTKEDTRRNDHKSLLDFLMYNDECTKRTEQQFMDDYNAVIAKHMEVLTK